MAPPSDSQDPQVSLPSPSAAEQTEHYAAAPDQPSVHDSDVHSVAPVDAGATRPLPPPAANRDGGNNTPNSSSSEESNYRPQGSSPGGRFLPQRLGDYELLEEIERGGMGVVYKARQLTFNRVVALKMIQAGRFSADGALERFRLEARSAGALNHPNIVPVYEIGEVEGQPFFSMAFVTGGSLYSLVKGKPLQPEEAARLMQQIAQAVQSAHDHGIIHRDLKPQNILLQRKDDSTTGQSELIPQLTDFGLARAAAEGSGLTRTGQVLGTPSYMSPEQATGDVKAVGPHSDVYSLGAVLYCTLTGRPPFESVQPLETMRQVREDEPVPPRRRNRNVPRDLETVCLKCLAKDPQQRYASAGQLAEDLGRFLADKPLRYAHRDGRLVSALTRLGRSMRRRPARAAYLVLSLAAFAALAAITLRFIHERSAHVQQQLQSAAEEETLARAANQNGDRSSAIDYYNSARKTYLKLITDHPDRRDFRLKLGNVYIQRGSLQVDKGELDDAQRDLEFAINELKPLAEAAADDPTCQLLLAEAFHNLGILYDARNNRAAKWKALDYYEESLKIREKLHHQDRNNRDYRRDLARSFGYQADTELDLGLDAAAKKSYDQAEKLRKDLIPVSGGDPVDQYQLNRSMGNSGNYYDKTGDHVQALRYHRERKQHLEKLAAQEVPAAFQTDLPGCCLDIARLQLDDAGPAAPPSAEAQTLLQDALNAYDKLARSDRQGEQDKNLKSQSAQVRVNLGKYHLLADDPAKALVFLEQAKVPLKELGPEPKFSLDCKYHLALAHALHSQFPALDEGERGYHKVSALELLEEAAKLGFTHVARLERDVGFQSIKNDPRLNNRFQAIVSKLKKDRENARLEVDKKKAVSKAF